MKGKPRFADEKKNPTEFTLWSSEISDRVKKITLRYTYKQNTYSELCEIPFVGPTIDSWAPLHIPEAGVFQTPTLWVFGLNFYDPAGEFKAGVTIENSTGVPYELSHFQLIQTDYEFKQISNSSLFFRTTVIANGYSVLSRYLDNYFAEDVFPLVSESGWKTIKFVQDAPCIELTKTDLEKKELIAEASIISFLLARPKETSQINSKMFVPILAIKWGFSGHSTAANSTWGGNFIFSHPATFPLDPFFSWEDKFINGKWPTWQDSPRQRRNSP